MIAVNPIASEILPIMIELAHEAGAIMTRYFKKEIGIYEKPDGTRVTDVDLAIYERVQSAVHNRMSQVHLYSEESPEHYWSADQLTYIVDELDGTSSYIEGVQGYAHQSALYVPDVGLLIGLVYYPWNDRLLYAVKDFGTFMLQNGETHALQPPPPKPLSQYRYAHPYRYRGKKYKRIFDRLGVSNSQVLYTSATRTWQMIQGELDVNIMPRQEIPKWDWAGEKVILEELGFHHSYINGDEVRFEKACPQPNKGYLICRPDIAHTLLQKLQQLL